MIFSIKSIHVENETMEKKNVKNHSDDCKIMIIQLIEQEAKGTR